MIFNILCLTTRRIKNTLNEFKPFFFSYNIIIISILYYLPEHVAFAGADFQRQRQYYDPCPVIIDMPNALHYLLQRRSRERILLSSVWHAGGAARHIERKRYN